MLEVTESALNYLKDYLRQEKIDSAIRVTTTLGGCGSDGGFAVTCERYPSGSGYSCSCSS